MTERLLVATDLGDEGERAIAFARTWAKRLRWRLTIAHAIPESGGLEMLFPQQHQRDTLTAIERVRAVTGYLEPDLRPGEQLRILQGSPGEELVKLARETDAELIVVGGSAGSVTNHLLVHAPAPVMITRAHKETKRIVAAIALDGEREPQLNVATRIARKTGARVSAIHVLPGTSPADPATLEALDKLQARTTPDCEIQLDRGDPAATIVSLAERIEAELIVVGTHARSGLARLVVGSVASEVVRRASCSVLVVPLSLAR